jgi:hypothetical protein
MTTLGWQTSDDPYLDEIEPELADIATACIQSMDRTEFLDRTDPILVDQGCAPAVQYERAGHLVKAQWDDLDLFIYNMRTGKVIRSPWPTKDAT